MKTYSHLPQNAAFVITKEHLSPGSEFIDATPEQVKQIKADGFTAHFKLYDDDDELYYSGYLKGNLAGSEEAFAPLDNYGEPNAGCTLIKYREADGHYHTL